MLGRGNASNNQKKIVKAFEGIDLHTSSERSDGFDWDPSKKRPGIEGVARALIFSLGGPREGL